MLNFVSFTAPHLLRGNASETLNFDSLAPAHSAGAAPRRTRHTLNFDNFALPHAAGAACASSKQTLNFDSFVPVRRPGPTRLARRIGVPLYRAYG